jgi:hypothetical protein
MNFHHDGEQGLVDAAAAFQQGGEEGSLPQFRDRQIQIPCRRSQHPGRVLRSSERSNGPAPMNAVAYLSISSWYRDSVAERIRSVTSVSFS